MQQTKNKIIENKKITPHYYKMVLFSSHIAKESKPGQFVHIRCSEGYNPLLRRPFSISKIKEQKSIEILYEVVGKGTKLLSQKKVGEELDVLGPLGNGFEIFVGLKLAVLLAGGMGVAPLLYLAEALRSKETETLVLIGARTKKLVFFKKEFASLGCKVKISTEDGTQGFKGLVTDLFKNLLSESRFLYLKEKNKSSVYACGPPEMLKEVAEISQQNNLFSQASLEERMACGVGACLGCPVKIRGEYKMVCKDGPVFNLKDIEF